MKRYISSLMALCLMFALVLPVEAKEAESFRDVPADFWAYEQINRCVQDGIVSGYNDGTFKPGNPVSYGAFSIMLARAFYASELAGYSDQGTATGEAIMNKHGILNGTSRSSASIGASLPREDMAQCMYNVLVDKGAKIPSVSEQNAAMSAMSDFFSISGNCRTGVLVCYTLGLLGGQSDGSFGPKNPMNRAQGCVVINRLRDYFQNNGGTTAPVTPPEQPETPVGPPEKPETPVTPPETPEVTDGPLFKLLDGENAQQMMDRINASTTYTAGYLTNGKPITEENIKELLAKFEETMPEGSPWYHASVEGTKYYYSSPKFGTGGGCNSYAYAISDALFDEQAPMTKHQNFDQLKVGDVIWVKNSQNGYDHVIVITSLTSNREGQFSATGAGGTRGVSWAEHGKFTTLTLPEVASGTYIYSRY